MPIAIRYLMPMNVRLKTLFREPLVHFLAIGLALFALSTWLGRAGGEADRKIQISAAEIEWLVQNWEARWRRPPTRTELEGLVDDYVRQEVLYREALAMGLDRDDQIIRRRMVQKIEFMTEDLAAQAQPTEAQLQAYFQENLERYLIPERRSFTHIYFNLDRRGDAAVSAAEGVLADLRASPSPAAGAWESGDRFMLDHDYRAQSQAQVARLFGQRFAFALFELEPGDWRGPIGSGYGLHLVRVTDVWQEEVPDLSAARNEVLRDFATALRDRADEAMYSSLASGYEIVIDEEAIQALSLSQDSMGGGGDR